jgi:hypothetical protein
MYSPPVRSKNLLLTTAHGPLVDGPSFRMFLESYRRLRERKGRFAELVLLTGSMTPAARQLAHAAGATVVDVSADFADYGSKNRHWHMAHFLAGASEFDWAITLDARDSILQDDPFAVPPLGESCEFVVLSSEGWRVGQCYWNTQNAIDFHASLRAPWHDYDYRRYWILNGSVAAGRVPKLAALVLARAAFDIRAGRYSDQGSYTALGNWIADWPGYRIIGPELPLVFHGGGYGFTEGVTIDCQGRALHASGRPYAIFHQWDRTPAADLIARRATM